MADLADVLAAADRIADAGRAASVIGGGVRAADVAGPVRAVGAALPGSGTAAAAQDLAVRWQAGIAAVADGFAGQGDALTACAQAYEINEQQLVEALRLPPSPITSLPGPGPR